jgi:hypothetical protein
LKEIARGGGGGDFGVGEGQSTEGAMSYSFATKKRATSIFIKVARFH